MSMQPSNDQLLSRKQAADFLGVKPQTLAAWLCTKRYPLPVVKIGRTVRYRKSDLEAFVSAHTTNRLISSSF
jgi:excisionase family DNA binding protein